ncbi:MAG: gliding motility-associated C-terminal domain-containing protein [Crocinitomicaceae bacterium]|nr:gliding motility-associated C-terminal domain-containing protein [Crocinitomicaceae bacterium]
MKNLLILFVLTTFQYSFSQQTKIFQSEGEAAFELNMGQYDARHWLSDKVEYAYNQNPFYVFFSKSGVTYRFDKTIRNPKRNKQDPNSPKRTIVSELIHAEWVNANPNVQIIAEDKTPYYFSYGIREGKWDARNISNVPGYKKIIYKNLYDHVDLVYEFHPEGGLKYSFILYPGANPAQIKLKYDFDHTQNAEEKVEMKLNALKQIEFTTSLAKLIEHAPYTFDKETRATIPSAYKLNGQELTFNLGNFDASHTIVIDPWVVSPTFTTSTAVWEVETDANGNVYSIGGEDPMELKKYDALGNLQWTYTTPWDTSTVWLGTMATDASGISYLTSGVSPEMEKIDNAGSMVWHKNNGGTYNVGFNSEFWSITFNCDQTKLLVGGTYAPGLIPTWFMAAIYDVNTTTGDITDHVVLDSTNIFNFGSTPVEVRSISASKGAKYIYLTHDDVGAITQSFALCPNGSAPIYQVDNTHNLNYKCENYLPEQQNGGGLKALIANDQYFYTHVGDEILQWDLATGALLNTASVPGGVGGTVLFGGEVVQNSGLAVDDCGNVYAGSKNQVHKYDANLNLLASAASTVSIYDVSVNANGEVVVCGAQSNNSLNGNRNGRIESVSLTACAQYSLICCDAYVCPQDTLCVSDAPITLTPNTPGGTWSGPGVNASTGEFDPAVAGPGVHTITYTLTCGSEDLSIVVSACAALSACLETNGDVTVSGGDGNYTWEEWGTVTINPSNSAECTACGGTWNPGFPPIFPASCSVPSCQNPAWVVFGSGATQTPTGNAPYQVSDGSGSTVTINDPATLPACSSTCTPPTITVTGTNVTCAGGNDGAADLTITSGTSTYSYLWNTGATSEDLTGLTAGTYSVTVTDDVDPSCTANASVIIADGTTPTAPVTSNDTTYCDGATMIDMTATPGSGGTINWFSDAGLSNNIGTGNTLTPSSSVGTTIYYVTETLNGCESPASSISITVASNPVISNEASTNITNCATPDGTITITANGTSYELFTSAGGSVTTNATGAFTNLPAGDYYVVVTLNGCTVQSSTVTISNASAPAAPNAGTDVSYCIGQNIADLFAVAGSGGTLTWYDDAGLSNQIGTGTSLTPNSSPGTTIYYVTETVAGCESPATAITITISASALTLDLVVAEPLCYGQNNGSVSINVNGGGIDPGAIFTITDADSNVLNQGNSNAAEFLGTGWYYCYVDNPSGCDGFDSVFLDQPDSLYFTLNTENPLCFGSSDGFAQVNMLFGAQGPYVVSWDGQVNGLDSIGTLAAGSHTALLVDSVGCTAQVDFTLVSPAEIVIGQLTGDPSQCRGNGFYPGSGTVSATASGGTGTLAYLWSDGVNTSPTNTWGNREPGWYYLLVTDANGCVAFDSVYVDSLSPMAQFTVSPDFGYTPLSVTVADQSDFRTTNTWIFNDSLQNSFVIGYNTQQTPFDSVFIEEGVHVICLIVSNDYECYDTLCLDVQVNPHVDIELPNVVTPNGDGNNDVWAPFKDKGLQAVTCIIVNRWGNEVFRIEDVNDEFVGQDKKGKELSDGVYSVVYEATGIDGEKYTGTGFVHVLRK